MRKYLLPGIVAAFALTACGGSGYSAVPTPTPMPTPMPTPTPAPVAVVNMFTQSVTTVVAAVTDVKDADPIEMFSVSLSDDTEPTPI